jgi:hypothetical protein
MKNSFCLSGLVVAFLGLGVAHAQGPVYSLDAVITPPANPPGVTAAPAIAPPLTPGEPAGPEYGGGGVSSWLAYPRAAGCCSPTGRNGQIGSELYLRSGTSVPIGGGFFGSVMKPGWDIAGGVRTLLFNPESTAAWTADLGLTNIHYYTSTRSQATLLNFQSQVSVPSSSGIPTTTTMTIPQFAVTPAGLNNTFVNLAFGREWYLWGSAATCGECKWRVGGDFGGLWGTERVDLVEIKHKTGSISGFFVSLHSDLEIPCGCCIVYAGLRMEYGYTFSDILQRQNNTDLQSLNFLATFGVRF